MTNYERIRQMSVDEMVKFLRDKATSYCPRYDQFEGECIHGWHDYDENDCRDCAIKYLESEVSEK